MNQNNSTVYLKLGIVILTAIVLGIISAIVWPTFFDNPNRFLLTELLLSGITLLILFAQQSFSADRQNRNCQSGRINKVYYKILILGCVIGFIVSLLGITTTLTVSLYGSIVFGIAVASFILNLGILLIINYRLVNTI